MEATDRIKIVMVGDEACGKTSLWVSFNDNTFSEEYVPTVFETHVQGITHIEANEGKQVELAVWDTGGREEYDRLRPTLVYGPNASGSHPRSDADVILACYSVDDPGTLENASEKWAPELRQYCPGVPFILIGCKSDTPTELAVNGLTSALASEAQRIAEQIGASEYLECSAKTKVGVQNIFKAATKVALHYRKFKPRKKNRVSRSFTKLSNRISGGGGGSAAEDPEKARIKKAAQAVKAKLKAEAEAEKARIKQIQTEEKSEKARVKAVDTARLKALAAVEKQEKAAWKQRYAAASPAEKVQMKAEAEEREWMKTATPLEIKRHERGKAADAAAAAAAAAAREAFMLRESQEIVLEDVDVACSSYPILEPSRLSVLEKYRKRLKMYYTNDGIVDADEQEALQEEFGHAAITAEEHDTILAEIKQQSGGVDTSEPTNQSPNYSEISATTDQQPHQPTPHFDGSTSASSQLEPDAVQPETQFHKHMREHYGLYEQGADMYKAVWGACGSKDGTVGGAKVFKLFAAAGVSKVKSKSIWGLADKSVPHGRLTENELYVALKLIALEQTDPDMDLATDLSAVLARTGVPLPHLGELMPVLVELEEPLYDTHIDLTAGSGGCGGDDDDDECDYDLIGDSIIDPAEMKAFASNALRVSKYVAPEIRLGRPEQAALGLEDLMGVTDDLKSEILAMKESDILKEFEDNGTDEDKDNLKHVLAGTYRKEWGRSEAKCATLEALLATAEAKTAKLEYHHVLALRMYTTSSYPRINEPLRQDPRPALHPFAATTLFIRDGIKRLRAVDAKGCAVEKKTLWRGMNGRSLPPSFKDEGGAEFACMSTTTDFKIAVKFAEEEARDSPMIFKFVTESFMSRGADISFLSVYPEEKEVLFPPLTYLQPSSVTRQTIGGKMVVVVEVKPHLA